MKHGIVIFSILLFLWVAGSSYCYVCEIRKNCGDQGAVVITEPEPEQANLPSQIADDAAIPIVATPKPHIIYFDPGKTSAKLDVKDVERLREMKDFISGNTSRKLIVTGHSDKTGSAGRNIIVSQQRGEFVKKELLGLGIQEEAIELTWKSFDEPIADNDSAEGRAKNRRTEIKIK